ncbi:MAG: hypothetical protein V4805_10805 [Pseudomonadota bacterium]
MTKFAGGIRSSSGVLCQHERNKASFIIAAVILTAIARFHAGFQAVCNFYLPDLPV